MQLEPLVSQIIYEMPLWWRVLRQADQDAKGEGVFYSFWPCCCVCLCQVATSTAVDNGAAECLPADRPPGKNEESMSSVVAQNTVQHPESSKQTRKGMGHSAQGGLR